MPAKAKKSAMTDEHKAALAEGRNQAHVVGRYLEALEAHQAEAWVANARPDSVKKRLGHRRTRAERAAAGSTASRCYKSGATSKSSWPACKRARPISAVSRRNS